ncbi:MAG: type II toxin-antitoxin system death-on-curing family toxin [Pseudonocardiaceae bacterium]
MPASPLRWSDTSGSSIGSPGPDPQGGGVPRSRRLPRDRVERPGHRGRGTGQSVQPRRWRLRPQRTRSILRRRRVYPDFATKAAILGYRLARNHALPDGNKRTALLAMIEFAERNGRRWKDLDEDETVETMVQVAAGTISEEAFIGWVSRQLEDH